jgi:hypothetical protein
MDYAREAQNALTWRGQMAAAGVDGVTIAEPVAALCTGTVLTTEWVEGERRTRHSADPDRPVFGRFLPQGWAFGTCCTTAVLIGW